MIPARRRFGSTSFVLWLSALVASVPGAKVARAQTVQSSVLPADTDPAIDTFGSPHTIYLNPNVNSNNLLLVFLPGTNGKTRGQRLFSTTAADLGYHVISLMYPDDIAATICWNDKDKDAFTKFRLAIIEGSEQSPHVHVNRANSIENRLVNLLEYLAKNRPSENWGHFLAKDGSPAWESIALAGHSQGGGHAALIATRHKVARVIMFSSPKDYSREYDKPAPWYQPSATPLNRYFAFVNEQDRQGCSFPQQLAILKAEGLYQYGDPANVDKTGPPFGGSHILTTNYPGTPVTSQAAHSSVMPDGGTPRAADGKPLFQPVWTYMLTADK